MSVIEKTLLLYREQGKTGERFSDTIERLGFENVEAQLLSDEILERKRGNPVCQTARGGRSYLLRCLTGCIMTAMKNVFLH